MADRSSNARVADSWQQAELGPEAKLLNYFRGLPKTSVMGTDQALFQMLLEKESGGTLDVAPSVRSTSARAADSWSGQKETYKTAKNLNEIKSKYDSKKTAVVPISPGSNVYRVIDTSKYQSSSQRVPGYETQAPTLGYYVVQPPKEKQTKQEKPKTQTKTPVVTEPGKGVNTRSDQTTVSAKTSPKPELFYSNDYKQVQTMTLDQIALISSLKAEGLLSLYNYQSIDSENDLSSEPDQNDDTPLISRSTPADVTEEIINFELNTDIDRYTDISANVIVNIHSSEVTFLPGVYENHISKFSGPFYDENGAYYTLTLDLADVNGIINSEYIVSKEEI